jgi:hypothetical protein
MSISRKQLPVYPFVSNPLFWIPAFCPLIEQLLSDLTLSIAGNAPRTAAVADIIFIHGLGGDGQKVFLELCMVGWRLCTHRKCLRLFVGEQIGRRGSRQGALRPLYRQLTYPIRDPGARHDLPGQCGDELSQTTFEQ